MHFALSTCIVADVALLAARWRPRGAREAYAWRMRGQVDEQSRLLGSHLNSPDCSVFEPTDRSVQLLTPHLPQPIKSIKSPIKSPHKFIVSGHGLFGFRLGLYIDQQS